MAFRSQLPAEVLVEVVQAADRLLTSRFPILHKYAAYAVDKLLLVKEPNSTVRLPRKEPFSRSKNSILNIFEVSEFL